MKSEYNEVVHIKKCQCGSPVCNRYGLSNGMFYQGSGWDKDVAERMAKCWNANIGVPTEDIKANK